MKVRLVLEQSLLTVSWFGGEVVVSLRVPILRVLVDAESPVQFRALEDHVEIKIVLLFPVDHPILSNFDSVLNLSDDVESQRQSASSDDSRPLSMDSDVKSLSSAGEMQFYCRSCSAQLTRSLRKYTLERMFTNQLLENAKDELSFRTVVRDLQTRSPMLQIVLLNPSSWCSNGYCLGTDNTTEPIANIDLFPEIKVLFSGCISSAESQLRMIEEWVTKNQADEVYMLAHQIKELIKCLELAKDMFPLSSKLCCCHTWGDNGTLSLFVDLSWDPKFLNGRKRKCSYS